jgi:hypothetical protein
MEVKVLSVEARQIKTLLDYSVQWLKGSSSAIKISSAAAIMSEYVSHPACR